MFTAPKERKPVEEPESVAIGASGEETPEAKKEEKIDLKDIDEKLEEIFKES